LEFTGYENKFVICLLDDCFIDTVIKHGKIEISPYLEKNKYIFHTNLSIEDMRRKIPFILEVKVLQEVDNNA
jgi:hypothetical protein